MDKITTVLEFNYNGKFRRVAVEKQTNTYIQGWNLHDGAKTRGATYSTDKMQDVKVALDYAKA